MSGGSHEQQYRSSHTRERPATSSTTDRPRRNACARGLFAKVTEEWIKILRAKWLRSFQAARNDDELIDKLANVQLRETSPGVFRMDHDHSRHDDRAISLALAATWLVEKTHVLPPRLAR